MPPKGKKKRASLHLDRSSGQIKEGEISAEAAAVVKDEPPVRQVLEVVEEEKVPEAIETIKKDAEEIEEAVETIGEQVEETEKPAVAESPADVTPQPTEEEVTEDSNGSVESLFTKATSPVTPEITVVGKRDKPIGVWVGAMLGIALAIGVSLIVLVRGPSHISFFAPKPTPTPTAAPTPTPLSVSSVNRKDVKVAVVNGGGVAGAGSKMKAFLESKGYTVTNVSNADAYTYDQTEIDVKSGKDAVANLLTDDLKSDYTIASSTGTVSDSAAYDVQVIVGK
jgi:hypothetical protein